MPESFPPSRQATQQRQASLVQAALALAAQHSPADITTGDLAQAVGLTQGAVFRHFASKEALWLAVLDWVEVSLLQRLHAAAAGQAPVAALEAVFMAHVDFVVAYSGVPRMIFQELQHAQDTPLKARVRGLLRQYRVLLLQLLHEARRQGLLAQALDVDAAAVLFIGSIQGLVMQSMLEGDVSVIATQAPGVFAIYRQALLGGAPSHGEAV